MPTPPSEWYAELLARLTTRLSAKPSPAVNPQCLSEHTLYKLLRDLEREGFRLRCAKRDITKWLQEVGLLAVIPVDHVHGKPSARTRLYSLSMAKSPSSRPDPLELLQSYDSDGVVCYFTAIAFHSLSTQPPVHHHLAVPVERHVRSNVSTGQRRVSVGSRNPLGTRLFTFEGIPFYRTLREMRLLPGVQSRYMGPTTVIRITNLEQTLLDTLHRPIASGGPAVVFEAWTEGLQRLNEERIADYVERMAHRPVAQRLGYMLDDLGYSPGPRLRSVLDKYLSELDPADPSAYQQLLPGMEYTNLRSPWLVYGP